MASLTPAGAVAPSKVTVATPVNAPVPTSVTVSGITTSEITGASVSCTNTSELILVTTQVCFASSSITLAGMVSVPFAKISLLFWLSAFTSTAVTATASISTFCPSTVTVTVCPAGFPFSSFVTVW